MDGSFYFMKRERVVDLGRDPFNIFWDAVLGYYLDEKAVPTIVADVLPMIDDWLCNRFPLRFAKPEHFEEDIFFLYHYPLAEQQLLAAAAERFAADFAQDKVPGELEYNGNYRDMLAYRYERVARALRLEVDTPPDCGQEPHMRWERRIAFDAPMREANYLLPSRTSRILLTGLRDNYLRWQDAPKIAALLERLWPYCAPTPPDGKLPFPPSFTIARFPAEEQLAFLNAFLAFLTDFAAGKLKGVIDYNHDRHDAIVEQFTELLDFLRQAAEDGYPEEWKD